MSISLEEYNKNLGELAERAGERLNERVMVVAATRMLSTMQNRIFRDGLDSSGNKIGAYSTKPYYVTKDKFIKKSAFKPGGKHGFKGEKIVKTGKKEYKVVKKTPKTMFLKKGYEEFRDIQGRQTNEVNLFMRGDMRLSFTLQSKDNEILVGFNNELQSKKRKGNELRFKGATGTIFPATEDEKKVYSDEVVSELRIVEREIINGI